MSSLPSARLVGRLIDRGTTSTKHDVRWPQGAPLDERGRNLWPVTVVRSPGSTANLGPGFDVTGLALDRYVWCGDEPFERSEQCWDDHVARIAFEAAGGAVGADLWFRFDLPPGRGLGFSAAARAAGAALARLVEGDDATEARRVSYQVGLELEGHGDNSAPSVWGGLHVIADGVPHRVDAAIPGDIVAWVPTTSTPTDESRTQLDALVARTDAVFNIGHFGLVLAACYQGRHDWLIRAVNDRLHQPSRLPLVPETAAKLAEAHRWGAAAWLSGSGPTIIAVAPEGRGSELVEALGEGAQVLAVDHDGSVEVDPLDLGNRS